MDPNARKKTPAAPSAGARGWIRRSAVLVAVVTILLTGWNCSTEDPTEPAESIKPPFAPYITFIVPVAEGRLNIYWAVNTTRAWNGFILERRVGIDTVWKEIRRFGPDARVHSDTGLPRDVYTYRLFAYNNAGKSNPSNEKMFNTVALIMQPSALKATVAAPTRVQLRWQDNSTNEIGFKIIRSIGVDSLQAAFIIDSVNAGTTTYTDSTVPCGTQASYRVFAYNTASESETSTAVSVATPFAGWEIQETGVKNDLSGVAIFDATRAIAVGSSGAILRTEDGGLTWTKVRSGTSTSLNAIEAVTGSVAVAAGFQGKLFRTTDGGATWAVFQTGRSTRLNDVFFLNADTGYVAGDYGTILRTLDGGATWTLVPTGSTADLFAVHFVNRAVGFAVGASGTLLRTTNGGGRWTSYHTGATDNFRDIDFADANNGVIVGSLLKNFVTTNQGLTWTEVRILNGSELFGVSFASSGKAITAGMTGSLYYSLNNGLHWAKDSFNDLSVDFLGMAFLPNGSGYVVGTDGTIVRFTACR